MKKLFLIALTVLTLRTTMHAQVASAALLGEVHDESGALAPAVTVSARHDACTPRGPWWEGPDVRAGGIRRSAAPLGQERAARTDVSPTERAFLKEEPRA